MKFCGFLFIPHDFIAAMTLLLDQPCNNTVHSFLSFVFVCLNVRLRQFVSFVESSFLAIFLGKKAVYLYFRSSGLTQTAVIHCF